MMKGKGKGKDQSDAKECPLQFPDFSALDPAKHCPRYSAVLQKTDDEGISIDDVEFLQIELESLLVSASKRRNQLEDEMQVLVSWQDKKKTTDKMEAGSSGKRSYPSEGKSNKKYKGNSGKAHPTTVIGRPPKSKNSQAARSQEIEPVDLPVEVPKIPKNEAPNRFWAFMEPYCAEITQEDVKMIEDWIKTHDDDSEYLKVPPLGKHFAYKWSQEDIQEEIKEGSKTTDRRKGLSNNSSLNSADGEKLLKKAEKEYDSDDGPFGPLTQRLMSCLIEENIMTSLEDTMTDTSKEITDVTVTTSSTKSNFVKSLNIGKTAQLEKRIQKELIQIGFLDADDMEEDNCEDELLTELRKLQSALKPVVEYNINKKKQLLQLAKDEMARQEIKKKLQAADAEVMEAQRKIANAKLRNKTPIKKSRDQQDQEQKDREQAFKALKEREKLIRAIKQQENQGSAKFEKK